MNRRPETDYCFGVLVLARRRLRRDPNATATAPAAGDSSARLR